MIPITPIQTIPLSTCINAGDLAAILHDMIGQLLGLTYSLAYIAGVLGFIIGCLTGWFLHKRGTKM